MAIMLAEDSKATPAKAVAYVLNPDKMEAWGCLELDASRGADPNFLANQMMQTMAAHGKGQKENERKYYHYKISFAPDDRSENGGPLTPEYAGKYAEEYAKKHWPGREVVWSIHGEGNARHIHFIVAACHMDTGAKLQVSNKTWCKWKDDCQELCRQYGLEELDWRKAAQEKKDFERQAAEPVTETFAEKGMKEKGKATWKDDLRSIIDKAMASSKSLDEFRDALESRGVKLTRCTDQTISYKLGDHKACRGDTLGGDYTREAVRDALEHNSIKDEEMSQEDAPPKKRSLSAQMGSAGLKSGFQDQKEQAMKATDDRKISQEERQQLRELGRLAGLKRSEIDEMCDRASQATWAEKQEAWADYKAARDEFWEEYNIRSQAIQNELNEAYKRRRMAKQMEWALDPRNRRKTLFGIIFAVIFLAKNDDVFFTEIRIGQLKREQQQLRKDMAAFKLTKGEAVGTLREKGLSLDAYLDAVKRMQRIADEIQMKNARELDAGERAKLQKEAGRKQQQRNKEYSR